VIVVYPHHGTLQHTPNRVGAGVAIAGAGRVRGEASILLAAMAQEHERAAGGGQAEWEALSGALAYTGGAAAAVREVLEGLEVRSERMRENLDMTGGLVLAESVSVALGRRIGRSQAHRLVEAASRRAVEGRTSLREELLVDEAIRTELSEEEIDAALAVDGYAGAAGEFVERALGRYRERR
jgi:3-carboxy-cis,cis-muconate cycloisomerase